MGYSPVEITVSIQRAPCQVQRVTEISKPMSLCAPSRWPPGSITRGDLGLLQQCTNGLDLDIALLQPLRHKSPVRAVLPASKRHRDCRWPCGRSPGRKALNRAGKRNWCWEPWALQMVLTGIDSDSGLGVADQWQLQIPSVL